MSTADARINETRIALDGLLTRALEIDGAGPPILLLHGFTDSADTWRPLLSHLAARNRRAIAVDLPGSGRADEPAPGPVLASLDRFVAAFIRRYAGSTGVVLAGNSLGGLAALRAAQDPGIPIIAVAGIAPGGLVARPHFERLITAGRRLRPLLSVAFRAPVPRPVVRGLAGHFYVRRLSGDRDSARRYASHFKDLAHVRRLGSALEALTDEVAAGCFELERIECPVLLIWGRRDPLLAVRGARLVLDAVPTSRLVLFHDCGHCPQLQRPQEVADLLAALPELPEDSA